MASSCSLTIPDTGRKPTAATAEEGRINIVPGSAPWNDKNVENTADQGNYKYAPQTTAGKIVAYD